MGKRYSKAHLRGAIAQQLIEHDPTLSQGDIQFYKRSPRRVQFICQSWRGYISAKVRGRWSNRGVSLREINRADEIRRLYHGEIFPRRFLPHRETRAPFLSWTEEIWRRRSGD